MKEFLYIKPQKTGTTSIRMILQPYTKYGSVNGISIHGQEEDIHHHLTYLDYVEILGPERLKDVVTFTTVRNPYDRWVSWWKYSSSRKDMTLNQFVQHRTNHQHNFINGIDNIHIIKFENLQQDFDIVCDKIGIPQQQLPYNNRGRHKTKHYTEYYDDETQKLVAEKYARDIECFGYEFGH